MREYITDYDYFYDFFDDKELLERFMIQFDNLTIKVSLIEHKRSRAQRLLLEGHSCPSIVKILDMKIQTVNQIRRRMIKNNLVMYAISDEVDHKKKDEL